MIPVRAEIVVFDQGLNFLGHKLPPGIDRSARLLIPLPILVLPGRYVLGGDKIIAVTGRRQNSYIFHFSTP
jgi:hypothetical protein